MIRSDHTNKTLLYFISTDSFTTCNLNYSSAVVWVTSISHRWFHAQACHALERDKLGQRGWNSEIITSIRSEKTTMWYCLRGSVESDDAASRTEGKFFKNYNIWKRQSIAQVLDEIRENKKLQWSIMRANHWLHMRRQNTFQFKRMFFRWRWSWKLVKKI